jgi:hypothetical protein
VGDVGGRSAGGRGAERAAAGGRSWRARISSHEAFTHDSLDSLGYDWGRIADPSVPARRPLKVYLPRSTDDVVRAVKEAKTLGEELRVRGLGHSSNDLVLTDRGSVLLTQHLDRILGFDEGSRTVTVQAGAITAEIDDYLAARGYGLPVIGDHSHITAGGFASAGGVSTASHRHGLFIDNVEALEYVTWDGEVVACSRTERAEDFYRLLAGTGQHGVITALTCRAVPIDKRGTVLRKEQRFFRTLDRFLEVTARHAQSPVAANMVRCVWIDLAPGRSFGHVTTYHETPQTAGKRLRNRLAYGCLHGIGFLSGRLPCRADRALKSVGMAGVVVAPKYGSIKNVEVFIDKIVDFTVGDPTRWFVVWAPADRYRALFRSLYDLVVDARQRHRCFTFVSVDVGALASEYLTHGDPDRRFCWIMFYLGIDPRRLTDAILDELVARMDERCAAEGAYRYMHTRTVKDPALRARIDPNAYYARRADPAAVPVPGD